MARIVPIAIKGREARTASAAAEEEEEESAILPTLRINGS
jgi:hypothetical protein